MENFEQSAADETMIAAEPPAPEPATPDTEPRFTCYICGEPSTEICPRCTRDTCDNHICGRCLLCSDCCTCTDGPR